MDRSDLALVEVYRSQHVLEAHAIRAALEEAGLRVVIDGELLQGLAGGLPTVWASAPRVLVPADQAEEARVLIRDLASTPREGHLAGEGDRCLSCGATMDPDEDQCCKCGWSFQASRNDPASLNAAANNEE